MSAQESNREISFAIKRRLGVLSESQNGWKKELNLVSWNGKPAKLDIREWSPDHMRMAKGVTLRTEEAKMLQKCLYRWFTGYGKQAAEAATEIPEKKTGMPVESSGLQEETTAGQERLLAVQEELSPLKEASDLLVEPETGEVLELETGEVLELETGAVPEPETEKVLEPSEILSESSYETKAEELMEDVF